MNAWKNSILDNAIQPIQQYSNTKGKNSSDSALIIDAMDLLYNSHVDGFCIISSDSDFTRLASRLRESEKFVLGMGESKTPRSFISACNKFLYLDLLFSETEKRRTIKPELSEVATKVEPIAIAGKNKNNTVTNDVIKVPNVHDISTLNNEKELKIDSLAQESPSGKDIKLIKIFLKNLVDEYSDDDGWIFSGILGNLLTKQFSDFDVRNFGFKRFVPFIQSLDLFDTKTIKDVGNESIKHSYFKMK